MNDGASTVNVSVIIPCHNSTKTLGLQLAALANQAGAPPFEVIVADNGSSDGLEEFLSTWHDRLDLRYVDAGHLRGASYARNVGMSVASADKWLFCDSDDVVARDWVAQGSAALDDVEVFSGPGLTFVDEELSSDLAEAWLRLDTELPPGQPVEPRGQVPWPILLGGNSGLRRGAALDVGGYDVSLSQGVEDNDLAVRVQLSGRTIAAAPGVRILYRKRSGPWAAFRSSRSAGEWHMALCQRYGLWERSPHLRGGWWVTDLPRSLVSGVRMGLTPSRRDWTGLASRMGLAVGMWLGWWRFRVARRLPEPAVGEGLGPAAGKPRANAARTPVATIRDARSAPVDVSQTTPRWLSEASVLILSPHLDDALFSASEIIRRASVTVWTVFAGEPATPQATAWDHAAGFTDSHEQITARRLEDDRAFAGTGTTVRHLPSLDAAYSTPTRRAEDLALLCREVSSWIDGHADLNPVVVVPAGAGVPVAPSLIDNAAKAGRLRSRAPRWCGGLVQPLRALKHRAYLGRRRAASAKGLVVNGDHLAVRDSVLALLADDDRVSLVLVEDLPYLWWHAADAEVSAVTARWNLEAVPGSLTVDRTWKFARIRHYESQLELMDREGCRLSAAETLPRIERHWVLTRAGRTVPGLRTRRSG